VLKVMLLVRRKEGMTREQFREYYERNHAVLAARHMSRCVRYVRNHVREEPSGPQDFDVITEFWFDIEPTAEALYAMADAATVALLEEDEERFMDRASMRVITVWEDETDPSELQGG